MSVLEAIFSGLKILLAAVSVLTIYKTVYKAIGFFARARKFSAAKKQHSYAIVICARNEEKVIGNLLDSIAAQRYPSEKVKITPFAGDVKYYRDSDDIHCVPKRSLEDVVIARR